MDLQKKGLTKKKINDKLDKEYKEALAEFMDLTLEFARKNRDKLTITGITLECTDGARQKRQIKLQGARLTYEVVTDVIDFTEKIRKAKRKK